MSSTHPSINGHPVNTSMTSVMNTAVAPVVNPGGRRLWPVHEHDSYGVHEPVRAGRPVTVPALLTDPAETGGALPVRRVLLTPASGVVLKPTYWLWADRIPAGALTVGPGREGIGKSLFCAWLAAQITAGTLPGIHSGRPRSVVYAATEDSWERTIAGRLIAADADMSRIYRIEVEHLDGATLPLSLPRDCDQLAEAITANDVALLVLDPLISAVDSKINVNSEELRGALEPLVKLADDTGCSVFGLAHFNKASGTDALSRVTGSRAFTAVARAAVAFARDPNAEDGSCVISQVKSNLGRLDLPSLRYRVEAVQLDTADGPGQWGRLVMLGETDAHVEAILNDADKDTRADDRNEIDTWLTGFLTEHGGAAGSKTVFEHGRNVGGWSSDQLHRAKRRLKIKATKAGERDGGWTWQLPGGPTRPPGEGGTEDGEGGGTQ